MGTDATVTLAELCVSHHVLRNAMSFPSRVSATVLDSRSLCCDPSVVPQESPPRLSSQGTSASSRNLTIDPVAEQVTQTLVLGAALASLSKARVADRVRGDEMLGERELWTCDFRPATRAPKCSGRLIDQTQRHESIPRRPA